MEAITEELPADIFTRLVPVNALKAPARELLHRTARLQALPAGHKLCAHDFAHHYLYLVKGSLALDSSGVDTCLVTEASERGYEPVFADLAGGETAVAKTSAHVVCLDKQLCNDLLQGDALHGAGTAETCITALESELLHKLYLAYTHGSLEVPSMPEVAVQIARLAEDPDAGIPELTRIVQADPAVAGTLLKAVNSPLFRASKPIDNIKTAITRLGLDITRCLATSAALRDTFRAQDPHIKARVQELWRHSVNTSALAYVIARSQPGLDPERALLAGLLHDIGVLPILSYMDCQRLEWQPQALEAVIAKLRSLVGVLVAKHWELDAELTTVIQQADDWFRDPQTEPDYCDVVVVAQLLDGGPRSLRSILRLSDTPAGNKLGFDDPNVDSNSLLAQAEEQVASINQLLNPG